MTYRAIEDVYLPPYKGSTLRGPFGHAFRKLVCTRSEYPVCLKCPLNQLCPYAVVFEPSPPEGAAMMQHFSDIPHAFVFETIDQRTDLPKGETFSFDFLVFGKVIEYFPYFVLIFRDMGMEGIGKGRGRIQLEAVDFVGLNDSTVVFRSGDNLIHTNWKAGKAEELIQKRMPDSDSLTIDFQTMTRLKYAGHLVEVPEFHILIRHLLRRLSALFYFYHDSTLTLDYSALFEQAALVRLIKNGSKWIEWQRYSRRHQEKMLMGGLVGRVTYEGNWQPFFPYLLLGEITHVGKNSVFGLGKYSLSF